MTIYVHFEGELRLLDDECPETVSYATVAQAVQDAIGYSGVRVADVTDYEVEPASVCPPSTGERRT